ncbi:HTH domain-containing protein [Corynebacterium lizhenjunii]|uniref:HTH domain-containing protein n=1 Tax=Corynebacterium lizhenjunii TaxID=2709394 RepID=A0A7T0KDL2_9CORY|nr:HTH domain-containing protein [Corynebacterium lizhenjunii]QPK78310.1 HTH domain-containing protein [Corynebacterium lizhenjunii]
MSKETDWFTSMAKRRVTVTEIAEILGVSRRTATNRVNDGLSADELIVISRELEMSPIHALVELGKITVEEALDFVDGDGRLLTSASTEELIFQLAIDSLPASKLIDLGNDGRDRVTRMEEDNP